MFYGDTTDNHYQPASSNSDSHPPDDLQTIFIRDKFGNIINSFKISHDPQDDIPKDSTVKLIFNPYV